MIIISLPARRKTKIMATFGPIRLPERLSSGTCQPQAQRPRETERERQNRRPEASRAGSAVCGGPQRGDAALSSYINRNAEEP